MQSAGAMRWKLFRWVGAFPTHGRRCRQDIKRNHAKLLRANQHLRYMWIPHTDRVVVVTNNPHRQGRAPPRVRTTYTDAERLAPLRTLLKVRVRVGIRIRAGAKARLGSGSRL